MRPHELKGITPERLENSARIERTVLLTEITHQLKTTHAPAEDMAHFLIVYCWAIDRLNDKEWRSTQRKSVKDNYHELLARYSIAHRYRRREPTEDDQSPIRRKAAKRTQGQRDMLLARSI